MITKESVEDRKEVQEIKRKQDSEKYVKEVRKGSE